MLSVGSSERIGRGGVFNFCKFHLGLLFTGGLSSISVRGDGVLGNGDRLLSSLAQLMRLDINFTSSGSTGTSNVSGLAAFNGMYSFFHCMKLCVVFGSSIKFQLRCGKFSTIPDCSRKSIPSRVRLSTASGITENVIDSTRSPIILIYIIQSSSSSKVNPISIISIIGDRVLPIKFSFNMLVYVNSCV